MRISDFCEIISGGTPSTKVPSYWNGNIPWISIKDFVNSNRWVISTEKTITQSGVDNSVTHVLQPMDLIISARGTVGQVALIRTPMAFNQSCFGLRCDTSKCNPLFLFYWLKSHREHVTTGSHGAVFDTITRADFDRIQVDLPRIEDQRHIVGTTSSLR